MKNEIDAKYHGKAAMAFWRKISAIKKEPEHTLAYIAACALQDHEQRVLQMLSEIEKSNHT